MGADAWTQVFNVIQVLLWVYGYVLIAVAVISWLPDLSETQFGQVLQRLTDPYLNLFRRFIPSLQIGGVSLDLSFIVAILVYFFAQEAVLNVLYALVKGALAA